MSYMEGAVQSYYKIKNMNAMQSAQMTLQKLNQEQITQQVRELLKSMPKLNPDHLGNNIDVSV